jgi:hypothetical protein
MLKSARVLCIAIAILALLTSTSFFVNKWPLFNSIYWIGLTAVSSTFVFGLYYLEKFKKSATAVFSVATLLFILGVWINQEFYFELRQPFEPFAGYEALAIVIALAAPSNLVVGGSAFAILTVTPLLQMIRWENPNTINHLMAPPLRLIICLGGAAALYIYRLHVIKMERSNVRLVTETEVTRRFAALIVKSQHLANTPLQTISNSIAILGARYPDAAEDLERIERAVIRMEKVTKVFTGYECHANWQDLNAIDLDAYEKEMHLT